MPAPAAPPASAAIRAAPGGRLPADWWEDLLIEICFRHFRGELQHKTQADIARAMQDWIAERGYEAADSTIRIRARKVWNAIKRDTENWVFAPFRAFPADRLAGSRNTPRMKHGALPFPDMVSLDGRRSNLRRPDMAKRPDRIEKALTALGQIASFITALTGAALAGHTMGWW